MPLKNGISLSERVMNLSMITGEGKRFKSSTEVRGFGQIVNLTPLFIGSGSMAIPAEARLKISLKTKK